MEEGRLAGEHAKHRRPSKPQRAGSSATGAGQSTGVPSEHRQPSTIKDSTSHQSYAEAIARCQVIAYRHQYKPHSYHRVRELLTRIPQLKELFLTTAPLQFLLLSCGLQQHLRGWLTGQVNTPPKCGIFHFTIWKRQSPPSLPITQAAREAWRCQGNLRSAVLLRSNRRGQGPIPSSPGQLNKLLSLSRLRLLDACGMQAEQPQKAAHSQQGQRKAASGRKTQRQL